MTNEERGQPPLSNTIHQSAYDPHLLDQLSKDWLNKPKELDLKKNRQYRVGLALQDKAWIWVTTAVAR